MASARAGVDLVGLRCGLRVAELLGGRNGGDVGLEFQLRQFVRLAAKFHAVGVFGRALQKAFPLDLLPLSGDIEAVAGQLRLMRASQQGLFARVLARLVRFVAAELVANALQLHLPLLLNVGHDERRRRVRAGRESRS